MEPAVFQTADNIERNNPLKVCPVVEDVVDEEVMDDKEEPSEESRVVRGGSWYRHCVAARASNPAHRGRRFATAVEDKYMKQVCYDYCFMRDQPGLWYQ